MLVMLLNALLDGSHYYAEEEGIRLYIGEKICQKWVSVTISQEIRNATLPLPAASLVTANLVTESTEFKNMIMQKTSKQSVWYIHITAYLGTYILLYRFFSQLPLSKQSKEFIAI